MVILVEVIFVDYRFRCYSDHTSFILQSPQFLFNVTRTPRHGRIDVLASNRVDVSRTNATFFTSDEISGDRVVYKHDDSESRRDTFHFVATAASGGGLSSGGTSIGMTTDHAL